MKKATQKIEKGLRELLAKTQTGNERLIARAQILNKLENLIKTLLLSTRRRLTGKPSTIAQARIDEAFQKFNIEIQEGLK